MNRDKDQVAERILQLTLEILFRLTGEDYTVVKKTSSERCQDPMSEEWGRPLRSITGPPPHPLMHEDINDQKILELTYKMIELLTGEVPIRCQDVAVYFSMEEWEYLEGHKDLYKDNMMEVPHPLTSKDISSKKTTPERCPHPLLPQDCKEEDPNVPQDHQSEDLTCINTTGTYVWNDVQCKEEILTYDYPDDCPRNSEGHRTSTDGKADDQDFPQETYEENAIMPDLIIQIKDPSSDPEFEQVLYSDSSPNVEKNDTSDVIKQRENPEVKSFLCTDCGKCFSWQSHLIKHKRSHTGEKPFSCEECGKRFSEKSDLFRHQRIHTGAKLFSCSECGKSFKQKWGLVKHQRSHTGAKPYSCSECGKDYNDKSNLIRHQWVHTGVKQFSCLECGALFTKNSSLVTHKKIHTGVRPFSCPECGKCFIQNSDLVRHRKTHTGEKPFPCPDCEKSFTKKSILISHQKTHAAQKPLS
ncbi:gastrula zinc finger protein XlCGF66.1-like [Ranitomeya variabilis]|uniref:gastrula zinc finger protein XlCGF66.1-like n=1 Tax=Ranitomeya variabilis TaxID=490064 RepID=UPI004055B631